MLNTDYENAKKIARYACKGLHLTEDQWNEVYQDTALHLVKSQSYKRAWGAAKDSARILLYGKSKLLKYQCKTISFDVVEFDKEDGNFEEQFINNLYLESLLMRLDQKHAEAIRKLEIEGKMWKDVAKEMGTSQATLWRWWKAGMDRLKILANEQ